MTEEKSQKSPTPPLEPEAPSSIRMVSTMGGLGLMCGVLIVLTFQLTLPRITRNKAVALERAIFEVVPGAESRTTFKLDGDTLEPIEDADEEGMKYFACYDGNEQLVGVAIEAAGQGFQDIIRILYGYSPDKRAVVGLKVLESKETPGLGDKIEKDPAFKANFDALSVTLGDDGIGILNPIVLVKPGEKTDPWQIESITGATISSRAIAVILEASTADVVPVIVNNLPVLEEGAE